jgi:F-type H+-transporting ATPase subunit b
MIRTGFLGRAGLAAGLLSLPAAARAAEGMPQLEFGNPLTISQVVWGAVIFLALYLVFANWGLPRVASVLEERDARINGDLDAARQAKANADAAVAELTDATQKARAEAQAAINAAVEQAKKEAGERSHALNERLEAQLREAERRIAGARNAAVGALRQVATETATLVVGRLTGRPPDQQAIEGAVGAALAARSQG